MKSIKKTVLTVATATLLAVSGLVILMTGNGSLLTPNVAYGLFEIFNTPFNVQAGEIDMTNATLSLLPDPTQPVLSCSSATIYGMNVTRSVNSGSTLSITAAAPVTATNMSIKSSAFADITTALGSFTNPLDLVPLTLGLPVSNLTLKNVNLNVDGYLKADQITIPSMSLSL